MPPTVPYRTWERTMQKLITALFFSGLVAALAAPVQARAGSVCPAYGGKTIFHCQIDRSSREISVCDMPGGTYLYVYGRPGRPELELERGPRQVEYTPWNGIGSAWWARLGFRNGGYFYDVGWYKEKGPDGAPAGGQVEIYKRNRNVPVSIKSCRTGTVFSRLDDLWERFE